MMNSRFIKIAAAIVLTFVAIIIPVSYKIKCTEDAKRLYKQGMKYYEIKDYSNAYYNFKQIKQFSQNYPLALLKQFQCANNLQDKKTALSTLKELTKITKDSDIRPYILYNDAILNQELKTDSEAVQIKKFKYINETYPNNDFGIACAYKLAKLIENKNKSKAKTNYINYLSYAPSGKFAKDALLSLKPLEGLMNEEDFKIAADAYYENAMYQESLDYYRKLPFEDNWVQISKCYKGLKASSSELETIKKGLNFTQSRTNEKDISYAIERLISSIPSSRVQTLQNLYSNYPSTYITPTVEYKLAESLTSIRSIKLYEDIIKNYPDSYWASNALWELIWHNYTLSRFQTCQRLYDAYFSKYKNSTDAPRISYWYAKSLLMEKNTLEAKDAFYKTINDYPLSAYAFLSARQLRISKSRKIISKKPIAKYDLNSINKQLFKNPTLLLLANNRDWQTLEELRLEDEYIKSWILYQKAQYPASINLAKKQFDKTKEENENFKISFNDWHLRLIYPVLFEDLINKYAKEYKMSPYLFLSLMREESHFNPNAKSSAGALGLTQLMPQTANFIAKTNVDKSSLLNEETNVNLGLKYYSYLVDYFSQNEFLAIMAYNAGPGNINKWIKTPVTKTNEIDVFIENVPYLETRNYIKKILSSYWIYINIYSNKYI